MYKGCSPGVHGILAGTPDGHPLYTPCTRPDGRVSSGYLDNEYRCPERQEREEGMGGLLLSSVKTDSYEAETGKRRLFKGEGASGRLLALRMSFVCQIRDLRTLLGRIGGEI